MRPIACSQFCRLVLLGLFLLLAGRGHGEEPFAFARTPGKLPKAVVPVEYAVSLVPDLERGTFRGTVRVTLDVREAVPALVLNAVGLEITGSTLDGEAGALGRPVLDAGQQTLTLPLTVALAPGVRKLSIDFAGQLREQPEGIYLVRYKKDGQERRGLATQFEPADARRMFPCWDEPVFRAAFTLAVAVPSMTVVVSNMPVASTTDGAGGTKIVTFQKTPPMPTYLLALFAGDLEKIEDEVDGVKLALFTTPGKKEQGRYALEVTKEVLRDFAEFFGAKYPLPKLDQVALPNTGAGGMENWGAIVYLESALLFDPATSSQAQREHVYGIVAHEIAHQWFGNLVTMAWWDNLWLNEGFASWMATKQMARRHPEWKPWLRAAAGREAAMRLDARATTHPIQQVVKTESQASDVFDEITYQKGQAVIRMIEDWLGEETFRNGVRRYVQKHALSNTTTADLWDALARESGQDIRGLAKGWTEQPGFPVIQVTSFPVEDAKRATCWQERFTVQQKDAPPLFWVVPFRHAPAGHPQDAGLLLLKGGNPQGFPVPEEGAVKGNIGGVGFFRVQYQGWLFERLVKALPHLAEADRLNLLNDAWALCQADRGAITDYLKLAETLLATATPTELEQILGVLGHLDRMERDADALTPRAADGTAKQDGSRERFRAWALDFLRPQLDQIGWDAAPAEAPLITRLRPRLLGLAAAFGDTTTLRIARSRFVEYFARPAAFDANLRGTVLAIQGRAADAEMWDLLHALARKTASSEQQRELYGALAAARDPALAARTLALALTSELPPHDAARLVGQVGATEGHAAAAWTFTRENLAALLAKLASHQANEYVPNLFTALPATAERAAELETWAAANLPPGAAPSVAKAADEIRFQADFRRRVLRELGLWLKARPAHATAG
ncbi:MAG: M1 family metallopeptidase [Chthoniobacter sp.]|nr:M1 family metallopeptidase [Chthoniobacter sp.]